MVTANDIGQVVTFHQEDASFHYVVRSVDDRFAIVDDADDLGETIKAPCDQFSLKPAGRCLCPACFESTR